MKLMYNPATCNHYGVCCEQAPELFSFAEDGSLKDENQQKMFAGVVEALAVAARRFAA